MTKEERRKLIEEKRRKELSDSISIVKANDYILIQKSVLMDDLKNFIKDSCIVMHCGEDYITIIDRDDYWYKELTIEFGDYHITVGERIGKDQLYPEVWSYEYNEIIELIKYLYKAYVI